MKSFYFIAFFITIAVQAHAWKPLFVGHRGSSLGVENTTESFINGVDKKGYDGLECDVRVTKDGVYVISHDETTNRLGGTLTVASTTYEELAKETYTQTRNGITYTGKICTVAEFLDICIDKDVFPVIELKWTTGINNNDMSKFAGLFKLVQEKGLESKAIFLTSMQKSLLHIRKNYPNVKCQFLCSSLAISKVEWCAENGLEPSISVGYFDQELVLNYHNAGMNSACWTVDSKTNYSKYASMGIYMITTNSLIKSEMPEIEPIDWGTTNSPNSAVNSVTNDKPKLQVYPNPATDVINVISEDTIYTLEILTITGRKVLHETINSTKANLNTTHLPAGIYILKINNYHSSRIIIKQ